MEDIRKTVIQICMSELVNECVLPVYSAKMQPYFYLKCFDMSKRVKDNINNTQSLSKVGQQTHYTFIVCVLA